MALTLWPVRCMSCNTVIAHKREDYEELLRNGVPRAKAMDQMGFSADCCRKSAMIQPAYAMGYEVPIADVPDLKTRLGYRGIFRTTQGTPAPEPTAKGKATPRGEEPAPEPIQDLTETRVREYMAV